MPNNDIETAYVRGWEDGYSAATRAALDCLTDAAKAIIVEQMEDLKLTTKAPWFRIRDLSDGEAAED